MSFLVTQVKPIRGVTPNRSHWMYRNLVHWWFFTEGSGNILYDNIHRNYGTIGVNQTWVAGRTGLGLNFPGSGSGTTANTYCNYIPLLSSTGSFTYSLWIYPRSFTNGGATDGGGTYFLDRVNSSNALVSIKAVSSNFALQYRYDDSSGLAGIGGTISAITRGKDRGIHFRPRQRMPRASVSVFPFSNQTNYYCAVASLLLYHA